MPWWFWVILWSLLVLLALIWLGWQVYRVVLASARAYQEFLTFSDKIARISSFAQTIEKAKEAADKEPAIFLPVSRAYSEYEQGKETRTRDRISRRIQKRNNFSQPQRLGDLSNHARKGATHGQAL